MTLEKLQVVIEAYTKPYREEMEKVKQQTTAATKHVERQTAKIRNSFKKIAGIVAAVFSVTALVAFGKSCIQLGSDLQEVQNVVDVTFGKMSEAVNQFSKNAITKFGLSELTAKKYMGTYGAMAKSFGIVEEAGYQMSAAITGLTGDVASFYNLSTDEAYTKLKSIFTGETESLKELGVVMTQTALDQYALNNGFGKTTAKMTEQEKVMLRYQFVMSALSDAQGDFARTSGSWANQVRVLSLQFDSLRATIGQGLINAFTPVIRVINVILGKLQTLASYFRAFTAALFGDANSGGGGSSVAKTADSLGSAAGSSGAVADNMGRAAKSAKEINKQLGAFDEINNISVGAGAGSDDSGGGGGGAPDFGDFSGELFGDVTVNPEIEAATDRIKDAVERLKEAAKPTTDALKRLWDEGLAQLGSFTWTALKDFWDYFLVPLGNWSLGTGFPMLIDAVNQFLLKIDWATINEALRNFWKALEPFAENVGEGLIDFFRDLLSVGADFINTVVPGGLNAIANALNKIDPEDAERIGYALGVIVTAITGFRIISSILEPVKKLFELIAGSSIVKGLMTLAEYLPSVAGGAGTFGEAFAIAFPKLSKVAGVIGTIIHAIGGVLGAIGSFVTAGAVTGGAAIAIGAAVVAAIAAIIAAIVLNWDKIVLFFTETIPAWWNGTVVPFFQGIPEWFSGVWQSVKEFFIEHWNSLIDWFKGIPDKISEIIDSIVQWFDELPGKVGYAIGFAIGTIIKWAKDVTDTITEEVPKIIKKVVDFFVELPGKIYDAILKVRDKVVEWTEKAIGWISEEIPKIIDKAVEFFADLPDKLYEKLILFKDTIIDWVEDAVGWANTEIPKILNAIIDWFNKLPGSLIDIGKNMLKSIWNGICAMGDWLKQKVEDFFGGVGQGIADALGFGKGDKVSVSAVQKFAAGGFPGQGQMFIARESGPELVGRIGTRSAVVNNAQIEKALENAIARGMMSFLPYLNGGEKEIHLHLEGDAEGLFRMVARKNSEYIQLTGKSAFSY